HDTNLAERGPAVVPRVDGGPPHGLAHGAETELVVEGLALVGRGEHDGDIRVRPHDRGHEGGGDTVAAVLGESRDLVHADGRTVVVGVRGAGRYSVAAAEPDPPASDAEDLHRLAPAGR